MNVLELDDLDAAQVARLLDLALEWKHDPATIPSVLAGQGIALIFEKPSARTRVSTERAVTSLGGEAIVLRGDEVGLGTRERADDVARTLAGYCDAIAARVYDHANLETMAAAVDVPIINLLSDQAHPCQALADVITLREEFGTVDGRRLVFVGDGNNVAASLAFAAALTGFELIVASPSGYDLDEDVVARARNLGASVEVTRDPFEAVKGADAIYADAWFSMGQETEAAPRRLAFADYQVNQQLLDIAGPDAIFLHCLPAHRGEEVTDEVLDGRQSRIWRQAENRLHSARALFAMVCGGVA
jgi:ornithine carbamoyltransferase